MGASVSMIGPNTVQRKREELAFRHQPYQDSPEGVLAAYLKNNKVRLLKEMVLQALRAYWLALAYQELGSLSSGELQRVGLYCVDELEKQANLIRWTLGLEYPQSHTFIPAREAEMATSAPLPKSVTESVVPELDSFEAHDVDGAGDWQDMFVA